MYNKHSEEFNSTYNDNTTQFELLERFYDPSYPSAQVGCNRMPRPASNNSYLGTLSTLSPYGSRIKSKCYLSLF